MQQHGDETLFPARDRLRSEGRHEMHNGRVSVSSSGVGQGTTFEIRLPLVSPPESHVKAESGSAVVSRRILVVDDNADAADSLALMFKMDGHEVVCAYGAHEAIDRVADFKPSIAFIDIGLPDMDGYELARRLRLLAPRSALRLVALTGYGQAQDQSRSLAAGFEAHLVKPASYEALCKLLVRRDSEE